MKKILIALSCIGALVASQSCSNDFLEVKHTSIVDPEGVYENAENVYRGLIGVYNTLYGYSSWYIKPHPHLANLPAMDLQADGWDAEFSKHGWTVESKSGFFENAWTYSYRQVSRANTFLADLQNVSDDVVPADKKRIYESEARCIRGYAYYYLTINFSRVPMLLTGETYENSPEKARPETDDEAWSTIVEDFEYAAQYLAWTPDDGQAGRFTKAAALGFAAKANMYLGNYEKAKSQLLQVIEGSGKQLNPVHGMIHWPDNPNSDETIFEVSFPEFPEMNRTGSYAKNYDRHFFGRQTRAHEYSSYADAALTYEFVRSFEDGDKRRMYNVAGWHGDHGDVNPYTGDEIGRNDAYKYYFMSQYEGLPNNHCMKWWKDDMTYTSYSVQLMRFTEILLNYAECCFRTGDAIKGWEVIKQVRNRAWGNLEPGYVQSEHSTSKYPFPTEILNTEVVEVPDAQTFYAQYKAEKGYTSDLWVVALTQERRKEFIYEFNFWYDLCRMGIAEEWVNCEYPKNGGATFYNTKTGQYYVPSGSDYNEPYTNASEEEKQYMIPVTARTFDWNPIHLVYPLPISELTANPLCKQNPGY